MGILHSLDLSQWHPLSVVFFFFQLCRNLLLSEFHLLLILLSPVFLVFSSHSSSHSFKMPQEKKRAL